MRAVLASSMLAAAAAAAVAEEETRGPGDAAARPRRRGATLGTGVWREVDAELGGVRYGEVTGLSCERDEGLVLHLLAAHLLADPANWAVHVDATGAFDVGRFYVLLGERLRGRTRPDPSSGGDQAMAVLGRLKLMRVFDFDGLVEAIGEVTTSLDGGSESQNQSQDSASAAKTPVREASLEIPDSQDEYEDEDMLFESGVTEDRDGSVLHEEIKKQQREPTKNEDHGQGLLIVDNLTQVASPILRSDYVQAQALLTSTLRNLAHLTHTNALCTLLVNGTAPARPSKPSQIPPIDTRHPPTTALPGAAQPLSVFASTLTRSALGASFMHLLDMHLFVSLQPLSKRDARLAQAGRGDEAEVVPIVEVLADRHGGSVGRWCILGDGGPARPGLPAR